MKERCVYQSRNKWSKYQNFKIIHNLLCKEMENCGITIRCNKNYRNEIDEIVQISEALILPVNLVLKYPDFLLHVDETGFNLNS